MKPNFDTEPHVIANMIKVFFREMQMPLCQTELLADFTSIGMQSKETKPKLLKNMMNRMDEMNRNILMEIVKFMNSFSVLSQENKMDTHNMALMFAPNIFREIRGVEQVSMSSLGKMQVHVSNLVCMMQNFQEIFGEWLPKEQVIEK